MTTAAVIALMKALSGGGSGGGAGGNYVIPVFSMDPGTGQITCNKTFQEIYRAAQEARCLMAALAPADGSEEYNAIYLSEFTSHQIRFASPSHVTDFDVTFFNLEIDDSNNISVQPYQIDRNDV